MFVEEAVFRNVIVAENSTLKDVLGLLGTSPMRMAIVENANSQVLGIITDGDVRIGLLSGATLDTPANEVMNSQFVSIGPSSTAADASLILRRKGISHLPVIDEEKRLLGLFAATAISKTTLVDNWVVIMAGGRGERLRPLTDKIPKPLVKVAGKSLIDLVLEKCETEGFHNFFVSVNYLGEMIQSHLTNVKSDLVDIHFLREENPLGTGGSLTLLPEAPSQPVLIMNSDVLHNVDLRKLIDFHESEESQITVCGRHFQTQIPFGVLESKDSRLISITEKPTFSHLVNAGIYVISPEVLKLLETNVYADMPDLLARAISEGMKVSVFPVHEFWLDVGTPESLEEANSLLWDSL
jgi:dTDP-glucose pyrophosphorylase